MVPITDRICSLVTVTSELVWTLDVRNLGLSKSSRC